MLSRLSISAVALVCVMTLLQGVALAAEEPTPLPPEYIEEFQSQFEASSMAVGPDGSLWGTLQSSGQIERMSSNGLLTGKYTIPVGDGLDEPKEFSYPRDITLGPEGRMWFIDTSNAEGEPLVGRITPTGEVTELPIPGDGYVNGITSGPNGDIWFTNTVSRNENSPEAYIGSISPSGTITKFPVPLGEAPEGIPYNDSPEAIVQGADGNLWFTDDAGGTDGRPYIGRMSPTGLLTKYTLPNLAFYADGMALGSDGNVWFIVNSEDIGRITPEGQIAEYRIPQVGEATPEGLALGSDGNLWFTCGVDCVGRVATDGSIRLFSHIAAGEPYVFTVASGAEGDLWFYTGSGVVRLKPPFAPAAVSAPTVSGSTMPGSVLSVSEGGWTNQPTALGYSWEICDTRGEGCESLPGETKASIVLTGADVGHTLRAVVTAGNVGGSASATSAASAVIQAPVSPSQAVPARGSLEIGEPIPEIGAAMTWKFAWSPHYTVVKSLVVSGVPTSGEVEVQCHGYGCPFEHRREEAIASTWSSCRTRRCTPARQQRPGEVDLTGLWRGRHLGVHARVSVVIAKAGWIGKVFRFTVRVNGPPLVQINCLAVGSRSVVGEC